MTHLWRRLERTTLWSSFTPACFLTPGTSPCTVGSLTDLLMGYLLSERNTPYIHTLSSLSLGPGTATFSRSLRQDCGANAECFTPGFWCHGEAGCLGSGSFFASTCLCASNSWCWNRHTHNCGLGPPRSVPPCLVLPCPVPVGRDSGQHQLSYPLPWPVLLTTSRSLKRNTSLWCAACFCSLFTSVTSKSRLQQTRRRCGMDSTWNPDRA